ncbi:hypothetical protein SCB71_14305 [Herbiconiux sp. KACC 21604]|uniref:hypothetical protein n=1 Tax=unclassified Herbiconiux TaxID=2618217 RepID=UPI00149261ED|nr:hypothetical protein [Herbiconiux sp. SALV-R1]QJU54314.1 hypothetical protein HL652_12245 [Herbiconiux sp. SALV-R1]WPO85384.1 hypothetical protein SCB71_14305 [Herbiconiux sp. KACC 21604]
MDDVEPGPGIRRRTLMGAVWAAPVIVAAVAAPSAAASGSYRISVRDAWQVGPRNASTAVITGYVFLRADRTTPASGVALTITVLPVGTVGLTTTSDDGFFITRIDTGTRQLTYQVVASDGSKVTGALR